MRERERDALAIGLDFLLRLRPDRQVRRRRRPDVAPGRQIGRRVVLDRRRGPDRRAIADLVFNQISHDAVPRGRADAAHHRGDDVAAIALHGRQQIEAGGAGIAGLDAVHPFDAVHQMVVVQDRGAGVVKGVGREIVIIAREALLDGAAEDRKIAGRRDLRIVRKSRCIDETRAAHAQLLGFAGHEFGEMLFVSADGFGYGDGHVVG